MKKLTLVNNVESNLPENLNVICVDSNEYVCTDETASALEDWDDVYVEDMSDDEFDKLPDSIREHFDYTHPTIDEKKADLISAGYSFDKSITGYYRLIDKDGNLTHDDSACEDVYNREFAISLFHEIVFND